jgi:trehalose-6-phosphate synthase
VLDEGLRMPADERAHRARRLRAIAEERTPAHWLGDQLAAAAD